MLLMSFRAKQAGMVLGGIALVALIAFGSGGLWEKSRTEEVNAQAEAPAIATQSMKNVPGKTEEERMRFVQSFGWTVEAEPAEIMEVIIPKEFDEIYLRYNDIQQAQGCDLQKLAGKRCKRYSYRVTNYPGADSESGREIRLNLLVYKNKIVGGDVSSLDLPMTQTENANVGEAFIHGFTLAQ